MTTTKPGASRGSSPEAPTDEFRDKTGKLIPDDHFENDPGPPRALDTFMSADDIARFNKETQRLRAEADKLKKD
jgi:hypothetical protein